MNSEKELDTKVKAFEEDFDVEETTVEEDLEALLEEIDANYGKVEDSASI